MTENYNKRGLIENFILILSSILAILMGTIISALIIMSLIYGIRGVWHYYENRGTHRAICEHLAETSRNPVIFVDNTVMGFGPNGSYGCYLINDVEE